MRLLLGDNACVGATGAYILRQINAVHIAELRKVRGVAGGCISRPASAGSLPVGRCDRTAPNKPIKEAWDLSRQLATREQPTTRWSVSTKLRQSMRSPQQSQASMKGSSWGWDRTTLCGRTLSTRRSSVTKHSQMYLSSGSDRSAVPRRSHHLSCSSAHRPCPFIQELEQNHSGHTGRESTEASRLTRPILSKVLATR